MGFVFADPVQPGLGVGVVVMGQCVERSKIGFGQRDATVVRAGLDHGVKYCGIRRVGILLQRQLGLYAGTTQYRFYIKVLRNQLDTRHAHAQLVLSLSHWGTQLNCGGGPTQRVRPLVNRKKDEPRIQWTHSPPK